MIMVIVVRVVVVIVALLECSGGKCGEWDLRSRRDWGEVALILMIMVIVVIVVMVEVVMSDEARAESET